MRWAELMWNALRGATRWGERSPTGPCKRAISIHHIPRNDMQDVYPRQNKFNCLNYNGKIFIIFFEHAITVLYS